jgi:hypothetical protein
MVSPSLGLLTACCSFAASLRLALASSALTCRRFSQAPGPATLCCPTRFTQLNRTVGADGTTTKTGFLKSIMRLRGLGLDYRKLPNTLPTPLICIFGQTHL